MAAITKERKGTCTSRAHQRDPHNNSPRKKRKLCIGFGNKMKKQQPNDRTHNHGVTEEQKHICTQKGIEPEEDMLKIHRNIDTFLEKIETDHFQENRSHFKRRLAPERDIPVKHAVDQSNDMQTSEEKDIELREELDQSNRLLDDLEQQMLEQQAHLMQKNEIITCLKNELVLKDQALGTLQKEFEINIEQTRILQQEILQQDAIIQGIKGQLEEKQTWIVQNNQFTEQLSRELEQSTRCLQKVKKDLQETLENHQRSLKEGERHKTELENLKREITSRNSIIETLEQQMQDQQLLATERTHLSTTLQEQLDETNEELIRHTWSLQEQRENIETLHREITSRNNLIEHLTKELTENQTRLITDTHAIDLLEDELIHQRGLLEETQTVLHQKQQEIAQKDNDLHLVGLQLQESQVELDMIRGEIDSRSRIIESMEEQLASEQTKLIEKTQLAEHLQTDIEQKQEVIQTQERQHVTFQHDLKNNQNEISHLREDLQRTLLDSESKTALIQQKDNLITQLEKDLKRTAQGMKEKNDHLLAQKRELERQATELNLLYMESEKHWADALLTNVQLRDSKERVQELQLQLEQREQLLDDVHAEFEKKTLEFTLQDENLRNTLDSLKGDLVIRNTLIAELEKQLSEQQMVLMERTQVIDSLQSELKKRDTDFNTHTMEFNLAQEMISSLQTEITARNQIIDTIAKQLAETQTTILEKASQIGVLFDTINEKDNEINKNKDELGSIKQGLELKTMELQKLQTVVDVKENELQNVISTLKREQGTITVLQQQLTKSHEESARYRESLEQVQMEHQQGILENDRIKRDLKQRLDELDEKCMAISQLRHEAENQQTRFTVLTNEFISTKQELEVKTKQIEMLQTSIHLHQIDASPFTIHVSERERVGELQNKEIALFFENWKDNRVIADKQQVDWLKSLLNGEQSHQNPVKEEPDIPAEKKSLAGDLHHIIKTGEEHQVQLQGDITWKEKLQICNEIEKCLDHSAEDQLKTKKLKDEDLK